MKYGNNDRGMEGKNKICEEKFVRKVKIGKSKK